MKKKEDKTDFLHPGHPAILHSPPSFSVASCLCGKKSLFSISVLSVFKNLSPFSFGVFALGLLALFSGCTSRMTSWNEEGQGRTHLALEELRIELSDLKHSLNGTKVDLQLLDEKVANPKTRSGDLALQLASLDRKLSELQKNQEKITADVRQLASHANQTSATLGKHQEKMKEVQQEVAAQNQRLEEVVKLKETLSSLSKVLKEKSISHDYLSKYKVKPGDSLEKIAKQQRTTVEAIKKLNDLTSDRIVVGQEIELPDSP